MRLTLKRLIAYWLDFVILASVLGGGQWLLNNITNGFPFTYLDTGYKIEAWVLLTMSLPVWLYFILLESKKGQTLGKKFLNIKVVNKEGQNIKTTQAIARTLVRLLPWELTHIIILIPKPWWTATPESTYLIYIPNALILIYMGYLFYKRGNKAIHDNYAKTEVIELTP